MIITVEDCTVAQWAEFQEVGSTKAQLSMDGVGIPVDLIQKTKELLQSESSVDKRSKIQK